MAQFPSYERPSNHTNHRIIAVRNIIREADAQRPRRIGEHNGSNPTPDCFGSSFWRRWLLPWCSVPLLRRWSRHDIGDCYYSPSVEGLMQLGLLVTGSSSAPKTPPRPILSQCSGVTPKPRPHDAVSNSAFTYGDHRPAIMPHMWRANVARCRLGRWANSR